MRYIYACVGLDVQHYCLPDEGEMVREDGDPKPLDFDRPVPTEFDDDEE